MKIVESNSNQLILRSTPYFMILFGLIFAVVGLGVAFFAARSMDLHCEHLRVDQITCELTEKLLGVVPVGQRTIVNIQHATIDESTDSDGDSTYRIVFITVNSDSDVPLTSFYSSGYNAKARVAEQINDFIKTGQNSTVNIRVNYDLWILIFPFGFGGAGTLIILLSKWVTVEMNRSEGVVHIKRVGLLGNSQEEYLLNEINNVHLQSSYGSKGSRTYRIAFRTTSDEEIPLTSVYTSGVKGKQRAVEAIQDFLHPYQRSQKDDPFT